MGTIFASAGLMIAWIGSPIDTPQAALFDLATEYRPPNHDSGDLRNLPWKALLLEERTSSRFASYIAETIGAGVGLFSN
jgi:hypothetical protein